LEEFRRLALKGVADELENPSNEEQGDAIKPQAVEKDAGYKDRDRQQDDGNAQSVTDAVYGMLMTGAVLRDPLLVSASAQHAGDDITDGDRLISPDGQITRSVLIRRSSKRT
jgi:hypothetical protein